MSMTLRGCFSVFGLEYFYVFVYTIYTNTIFVRYSNSFKMIKIDVII